MRARTFASIHIQREPDNKRRNLELGDPLHEDRGVFGKACAADRIERRGKPALDIGKRQADRLGADIKPHQPIEAAQPRGEFFEG